MSESPRFPCPNPGCQRSFLKKPDLTQHLKDCGQFFSCPNKPCASVFKNKVSLRRHVIECGASFRCPNGNCDKHYKTRAGLQQHIKLCGYQPCPCGYRLNVIGEYVKHQRRCHYFEMPDAERNRLLKAASEGNLAVVQKVVKEKPHLINLMEETNYCTILHLSSANGHTEVVRWITKQPDLMANLSNREGKTALFLACENGHLDILHVLLPLSPAGVNIGSIYFTPLSIACRNGHIEVVRELLRPEHKLEVNKGNNTSALSCACDSGNLEILELILNVPGVEVNAKLNKGGTTLHHACQCNQQKALRRLLKVPGIDVNATTDLGFTPLLIACQQNRSTIAVELLKDPRVDANKSDIRGRTPLWMTAKNDYHRPVLNILSFSHQRIDTSKVPEGETFPPKYQKIISEYDEDPDAFRVKHGFHPANPYAFANSRVNSRVNSGDSTGQEEVDEVSSCELAPPVCAQTAPTSPECHPLPLEEEETHISAPIADEQTKRLIEVTSTAAVSGKSTRFRQQTKRLIEEIHNEPAALTPIPPKKLRFAASKGRGSDSYLIPGPTTVTASSPTTPSSSPPLVDPSGRRGSRSWALPLMASFSKLEGNVTEQSQSLDGVSSPPSPASPHLLNLLAAAALTKPQGDGQPLPLKEE